MTVDACMDLRRFHLCGGRCRRGWAGTARKSNTRRLEEMVDLVNTARTLLQCHAATVLIVYQTGSA